MKVIALTLIAFFIFLFLIVFTIFIYFINLEWESGNGYGGGSLDSDPELSPRFSYDFAINLKFNSIFVAGPIMLGIISLMLIIPNIVLQIKKIPPRRYMLVIAAGILIFFGAPYIFNGLSALAPEHFERQPDYRIVLINALIPIGIGSVQLTLGIILLKKAKLRSKK